MDDKKRTALTAACFVGAGVWLVAVILGLVAWLAPVQTCKDCRGIGKFMTMQCGPCGGDGTLTVAEKVFPRSGPLIK